MVDTLAIQLTPRAGEGHWTAVDLVVNGQALKDLVTDFESERGYEPAGGYDSFAVEGLQLPAERLTGTPNLWPGRGEVVLLVCSGCGEEGCWPLFARVSVGEETVDWHSFSQPHRPSRDYTDLRFRFDRRLYDDVLDTAFGQR
ncbi:MAG: hypothetical protein ACRDGB_12945 [Candidatus Limnocylindria bacterium]